MANVIIIVTFIIQFQVTFLTKNIFIQTTRDRDLQNNAKFAILEMCHFRIGDIKFELYVVIPNLEVFLSRVHAYCHQ
jgi:hypothetical protein